MKKLVLLFFLGAFWFGTSQNKPILFGFTNIPQNQLLNPGSKIVDRGYFAIPLLNHQIHIGSTGVTLYDVFADDGTSFSSKLQNAIYAMDASDYFSVHQQTELFSGGIELGPSFQKDRYISFGMFIETNAFVYFPKDYAILAYEGNHNNIGREFNLGQLNASGELLSVFHFGYKKENKKFTYGIRGKIYSSVFDVNSTKNRGTFVTTYAENNYYRHYFNLQMYAQTAGLKKYLEDENSDFSNDRSKIISSLFFGGNLGLGVDFGITYNLAKQWELQASVQDIGFIRYTKDVENYNIVGDLVYEGIHPLFPESGNTPTAEDYWQEVADQFEELFTVDTTYAAYTRFRPIKLNAALQYNFGTQNANDCNCLTNENPYQNALGVHIFVRNRPKKPQAAASLFYYRKLLRGLAIKATYTADSYSFSNIGLGLATNFSGFNFYIAADNILNYSNLAKANSLALQFGFNYIFNKK